MRTAARRVSAVFWKDLRDAIRDARVLIALVLPLGIGIFYSFSFNDDAITVHAEIAVYAIGETALLDQIASVLDGLAVVEVEQHPTAEDVERVVSEGGASIGLIVPEGFDQAVKSGANPQLRVIRSPDTDIGGDYVLSALEPSLRAMAGQTFPVTINVAQAAEAEPDNVIDRLGVRTWSLAISVMMMIALIAALAVPIVLAEEFEKKTIDALVLAMPYREVIMAKALLGLFYMLLSTIVFLIVTDLDIHRWGWFIAGVGLTSVASLGFGLLLAGLFKNANQLNTWSGIFLLPFIVPAIVIGQPLPDIARWIAEVLPSGAGMKLVLESLSRDSIFDDNLASTVVLIAWSIVAFGALLWQLKRRQD